MHDRAKLTSPLITDTSMFTSLVLLKKVTGSWETTENG